MARKPVVNRDVVLTMLQEGRSTQQVADHFHVSRQAIDLHRRDFINHGLLKDTRAPRKPRRRPFTEPISTGHYTATQPDTPQETQQTDTIGSSPEITPGASLDDLIELMITAFSALKRVPEMEAQVAQYKDAYERALKEVERLTTDLQKRKDQEQRWNLTQQLNPNMWPKEN